MEHGKRPTLPRGLRWDPRSPHICFGWRDERGRQHQQSTHTDDPAKALAFKQDFQKENREAIEERRARAEDQGRLPLGEAAKMYFNWKATTNRDGTIAREKRIFKQIEKFIGASVQLRRIDLELIREYQQERRKQISPKRPVVLETEGLGTKPFQGKVVLLVDRHTASAGEMIVVCTGRTIWQPSSGRRQLADCSPPPPSR